MFAAMQKARLCVEDVVRDADAAADEDVVVTSELSVLTQLRATSSDGGVGGGFAEAYTFIESLLTRNDGGWRGESGKQADQLWTVAAAGELALEEQLLASHLYRVPRRDYIAPPPSMSVCFD